MEYCFDDLFEIIKSDNECNFIAMAITPLQAIGVDASVLYLQEKGIQLSGYILMTAHAKTGRGLKVDQFSTRNSKIKYIDFDYDARKNRSITEILKIKTGILRTALSNNRQKITPFYFVWTEPVKDIVYVIGKTRFNYNLVFVKIDDGAASYINPFSCKISYLRFNMGNKIYKLPGSLFNAFVYALFTKIMEKSLSKSESLINANIFLKTNRNGKMRLTTNKEFVPYYIYALKQYPITNINLSTYENSVIINTQSLLESNITDGVVDFNAYKKVSYLLNETNEHVVIKPHPREMNVHKYETIGWELFTENNIAQEIILAKIKKKPKCIIGIYSSTLLNAKGIFDIPVISLAKILLREKISSAFRAELRKYVEMYESIVLFPEDYEELRTIIRRL